MDDGSRRGREERERERERQRKSHLQGQRAGADADESHWAYYAEPVALESRIRS